MPVSAELLVSSPHPHHPLLRHITYQRATISPTDETSITRDDSGTISTLHDVRPTTGNHRDASDAIDGRHATRLTPIQCICQHCLLSETLSTFRQTAARSNADSSPWSSKCVQAFSCARLSKERLLFLQAQKPFGSSCLGSNDATGSS